MQISDDAHGSRAMKTSDEELIALLSLGEPEPLTEFRKRLPSESDTSVERLLRIYFEATTDDALRRWFRKRVPRRY